MRKVVAILLVLVFAASLLPACSSGNGVSKDATSASTSQSSSGSPTAKQAENFNSTGFPIVNTKITLKLMGKRSSLQGQWDQLHIFTEMEKKTNIKFEFNTPAAEAYEEKKNLAFASGDIPDIFFGGALTSNDITVYGKEGVLIPLENLVDKYAPELKAWMAKDTVIKKNITSLDGHIYSLPMIADVPRDLTTKLWINGDWLKNVNMKMPTTVDELYAVAKAFKTGDPNKNGKNDEIPLSSWKGETGLFTGLLCSYGYVSLTWDVINNKVIYAPIQDGYKEFLALMQKLYKEGLLDNECFEQTSQQVVAKGNEGSVGIFSNADAFLVVKGEDDPKYLPLPPLTSSVNSKKTWPKYHTVTNGTFAVTNKNKYPEASIRYVDYLYSYEGGQLRSMGIEGTDWKWLDSNKTNWTRLNPQEVNKKSIEEYRGGWVTPAAGSTIPGVWDSNFILKTQLTPTSAGGPPNRLNEDVQEAYVPYWRYVFPPAFFSADEQKQVNQLETDIKTYVDQKRAAFIIGEPLSGWDAYVSELKKMGVDKLVTLYQTAYDRWNK